MTRVPAFLLALMLAAACSGGSHSLTPVQRLHAAVKAAQATFDPDSAGGTGYGTTPRLVRRMGPGAYGTPRPFPDDFAFRPGVVYAGIAGTDPKQAILWVVDPSGRAVDAYLDGPHKVVYQTRSRDEGIRDGMTVIRPGVLSGDMVRAAFSRAGFARVELSLQPSMAQERSAVIRGQTDMAASQDQEVLFTVFPTAAQARKQQADEHSLPGARSVVVGNAWVSGWWRPSGPDRSRAFARAVAELRREARTE
jgi:hypothetical protein